MICPQPLPVLPYLYRQSIWKTSSNNEFLITFDDGPGELTESILEWCDENSAKLVFFILPNAARERRELVLEASRQGHLIGTHFLKHQPYWLVKRTQFQDDLKKSVEIIEAIIEKNIQFCRAPFGRIRPVQESWIKELGLKHVFWSVNSCDYKLGPVNTVISRISGRLKPGNILLMHDGPVSHPNVINILDHIQQHFSAAVINFNSLISQAAD